MPAFVTTSIALFFAGLFSLVGLHKLTALNAYAALVSNYVPAAVWALLPARDHKVASIQEYMNKKHAGHYRKAD